ncbi:lipid II flippase MurJ [Minwuia thermotolerans]
MRPLLAGSPRNRQCVRLRDPETRRVSVLLSAPVAAMTGATIAFLQAQNRFFIATIGTAIINLVLIFALLIPADADTLLWLAGAILAGALIRWLVQVLAIGRGAAGGFVLRPWLVDRILLAHFGRTAAAEAVVFFYPFALRAIATLFGVGALASVNFATKLVLLPLGVAIMTLTTVLLPRLAGLAPREGQEGDIAGLRRMAGQGQFWTLVLSAMSAAVLIVHARWLVELAFGWGEIGDAGLRAISLYTAIYSISLLPMGLNIFLRRVLNTMGDTSAPMIAEICGFAAFVGGALAIVALGLPLEAVLLTAAGGGLVSMSVLLRAPAGKAVRLGERLIRPELWLAVILSGVATAAPGLILERVAPGHAWLPAIAIAAGGMAGLCAALAVNREARAAVRTLLPRRQ